MNLLSVPPLNLRNETLSLVFGRLVAGDEAKGLVPYYHYRIALAGDVDVGHINFRVGDTPHILHVAGHIGYEIKPEYRGQRLSYAACMAIAPFVRTIYPQVILTSDPGNAASLAIIQKLGAVFIDDMPVAESDPAYAAGARLKRRYRWEV